MESTDLSATSRSSFISGQGPLNDRSVNSTSTTLFDDNLVTRLQGKLQASRSKLDKWVAEQKLVCDNLIEQYQKNRDNCQTDVDSKLEEFLTWKLDKRLNISEQSAAEMEHNHQQAEESLQKSISDLQEKVSKQKEDLEGKFHDVIHKRMDDSYWNAHKHYCSSPRTKTK